MSETILEVWSELDGGDVVFSVMLAINLLIILYALSLIHRKLRLVESELGAIRKDQSVISEELEFVAAMHGSEGRKKET